MATRISTATRNAEVTAVANAIDGGPAAGTIDIRTGAQPATPDTTATGTLLATLTLADPAITLPPTTGVGTFDTSPVVTTVGLAAGTAGWFRVKDSTGAPVFDGSAGGPGSGAQMILDNPVIAVGQVINFTAGTVTAPIG